MRSDLLQAKKRLFADNLTCALVRGETVYTSTLRGVRPLVQWAQSGENLRGVCAADKVVGKATAFLYVHLGAHAVYARVISETALVVLRDHDIETAYDTLVPYIINRQGDGMCLFEKAVLSITDPENAFDVICAQLQAFDRSAD